MVSILVERGFICIIKRIYKIAEKLAPKQKWFMFIFAICLLPRIVLVLVNKECNDDHMTPIMLWQESGSYPQTGDCWECFQPPLFYAVIKAIAEPFSINTWEGLYKLIQWFNLFISAGILWLILLLLQSLKLSNLLWIASSLFWGLNPELISIGALATNDTVLIFFGFLVTWLMIKQWRNLSLKYELSLVILISLLAITKGNALVFATALFALFGLQLIRDKKLNIKLIARRILMGICMFVFIGHFGKFFEKHDKLGYAFTINQLKQNPPNLFEEDTIYDGRKGVTTIANSFFRMHIISLLHTPYNLNGSIEYPLHRTSFWGQLFGQFSNYTFERYPASWVSQNNDNFNFSRINYLIHLPLFALMLWGIANALWRQLNTPLNIEIIHLVLVLAFTFFVMRYSYIYRDFSNMKVIFIYPSLFSIITLFTKTLKKIGREKMLSYALILAAFLYQVNFIYLIRELLR